jgi:hypothetical protein
MNTAEMLPYGHETHTFTKLSYYRLSYLQSLQFLILVFKQKALNIYFKILSEVFKIKNTSSI